MAFVVVYDACVLYPAPLRDLLIRLAREGLVRARWTDEILDECFRAIRATRPHVRDSSLLRTRELMNAAIPDVLVSGYQQLMEGLELPDADDRHVLAAAVRCDAQAIVTFNLKDFPAGALHPFGIEAIHPDEYVSDLFDLEPRSVLGVISAQAAALKNPPRSQDDLLGTLSAQIPRAVARVRELLS